MEEPVEREDVALVAELSAQFAVGGLKLGVGGNHKDGLRGQGRKASNAGPQSSTRTDSDEEPILVSVCGDGDSAECVPVLGAPPG